MIKSSFGCGRGFWGEKCFLDWGRSNERFARVEGFTTPAVKNGYAFFTASPP